MSQAPVPPIIRDENGDISFSPSVDEAQRDMEAVDVLNGEYDVFDSEGRRLAVTAEGATVLIRFDPEAALEPGELARRLRYFVGRVGPERVGIASPEAATLHELVGTLASFFDR